MDKPYFGTSIVKGKSHNYFSFTTRSLSIWNTFYNMWYSSGIKCVPENISMYLTPISLAYWFMDDGGRTGSGIHLNTNAFSLSDVERLCHILNDKFNLKCTIHSRNRIYI